MTHTRKSILPLLILGVLALASVILFMTINAKGNWSFILPFRGTKLAVLILVGYSIAVSTVLFQTISNNRILTPAIMGFDSLYILIQSVMIFTFGISGLSLLPSWMTFIVEVTLMTGFACLLYSWLLQRSARNLHLLLLAGIVFGLLFRSLSGLVQRLIDPNDFVVLQDRFFASFNITDPHLLGMASVAVGIVSLIGWRLIRCFDVLALGSEPAITLGVDYNRTVMLVLVLVTILVAVSTALVGPITFLGLLVANLTYLISRTHKHTLILPTATLLAVVCLVGGQVVLEQVFAFNTALSIIIEFTGGLMFIGLLIKGATR